eukprot:3333698-Karenia_brevis.AAC.1
MDQEGLPSMQRGFMVAHGQPNPYINEMAATRDINAGNEESDVALELLQGQNVPRSQRVRLAAHTEKWLFEFIED